MKVLSCFDGISCGQVALSRIGVTDYQYFASEIDKHAIKVTQHNFPNTIQMGDIRNLVNIAASGAFGEVDLLMGGSPCQGFSNAGKQLGFVDPRSKLFFDFVAIKNFLKPKWFLLENVRMKKQDQDIISALMGVEPIKINSADFSAQNRVRLYWTNIPVAPWQDRGIVLRDILEHLPTDKKGEVVRERNPLLTLKGSGLVRVSTSGKLKRGSDKSGCLTAGGHSAGNHSDMDILVYRKPVQVNPDRSAGGSQPHIQNRVFDENGKSHALTASFAKQTNVQTYMKQIAHGFNNGYEKAVEKSPPLTTSSWQHNNFVAENSEMIWRRLSVRECERLQTLPDDYTAVVSNSQRYKAIGNGWTVDVIAHILKGMYDSAQL